jgi:hypothetical protein
VVTEGHLRRSPARSRSSGQPDAERLGKKTKESNDMAYLLQGIGPDPAEAGADGISCEVIDRFPENERPRGVYSDLTFKGLRVPELLVPKKLILLPDSTPLLDTISFGCKLAFNRSVTALIERIAPSQTEFIPFEVELLDGSIKHYYFMNVLRHLACLCWNMGNVFDEGRNPNGTRDVVLPHFAGDPLDVRIRRDAHRGVHIWHEEDAGKITSWIFISDELGGALEESGATGIRLIPVKEI